MDRRDFLKNILSTSLFSPFFLAAKPGESEAELYLISDSPHRFLLPLLKELQVIGLFRGQKYALDPLHPKAEDIQRALVGWIPASFSAEANIFLSFQPLHNSVRPSFALVKEGRVIDIRQNTLRRLWQKMNAGERSDCLTLVTIKKKNPALQPGQYASIVIDGEKIDRILLNKSLTRPYAATAGKIIVRIEGGSARVENSSCPHKICVSSRPVFYAGERIICAPNRFSLKIEGRGFLDTVIG